MEIIKPTFGAGAKVVTFLKKGGIVICPTDTVYGFLADAQNKKTIERIYKIKKRAKSKPLSLFVTSVKMAKELAFVDLAQEKKLKRYWPGKYTFILKRKPGTKLYGIKKDTVALRIPNHAFLQTLLKKINRPLVQTSVNISSQPVLNNITDIINQFGKQNILILDGKNVKKSKASKILDLTDNKIKILRT